MEPVVAFFINLILIIGMFTGLFGLVVPVFPGITVIWAFILAYGLIFGFGSLGGWLFAVITLLAIGGWFSDNLLMGGKALQQGANWLSLVAAFITGFLGSIFLTPIGGIFTALLGLFLAEYARRKNSDEALEITKAMAIGWGWSFVVRFGFGVGMIGLWALWALWARV